MNTPSGDGKPAQVCTDGAGRADPGPGGWAWAVPGGPTASGGGVQTTKNRMELMAIREALQALEGPVEVYCDSNYVVNCFNKRWWESWIRRGWRNSDKKAITNQDLWAQIIEQVQSRPIAFFWAKPNTGNRPHDEAARLAAEAADSQDTVQEQSLF